MLLPRSTGLIWHNVLLMPWLVVAVQCSDTYFRITRFDYCPISSCLQLCFAKGCCNNRSRPRRPSPSRRASSPISYRQRDMLRRDSKRSPPRRGSRRSPSPPSPPRRRSSRERRSDRVRPASRERASGKKAVAEDKAKSKKDSKENDKSKSKPSSKKVEPAKVSATVTSVHVYHSPMPVLQFYPFSALPPRLHQPGYGYNLTTASVGTIRN